MAGAARLLMLLLKNGVRLPSDFFSFVYVLFVLMPFCVLHKIRGEIEGGPVLVGFMLLAFPLVVFGISRRIRYKVTFSGFCLGTRGADDGVVLRGFVCRVLADGRSLAIRPRRRRVEILQEIFQKYR